MSAIGSLTAPGTPTYLSVYVDFAAAIRHHQQVSCLWQRNVDEAMHAGNVALLDDAGTMRAMHASIAETIQAAAEARFGADVVAEALDRIESGGTLPLFHDGYPVPGTELTL